MADILSRIVGTRRTVGHSRQNDKNDVSIASEMATGTQFNWLIDRFDFQ